MRTKKTFRAVAPLLFVVFLYAKPVHGATGINQQINYQARLLNSAGAVVADGNYNIRFKIYQDGAGTAAGDPGGTLKWTELWQNNNSQGVVVKNGYFSVSLGSLCAFTGGSCQGNTNTAIDFNQDALWLSIDIAGTTTGTPTYDGEMLPMRRLSASPYALNAGLLGGLSATQFLQLAPNAVQADASTNSSLFINKSGASGNIVQLQNSGVDVFTVAKAGTLAVTTANTTDTATLNSTNTSGTQTNALLINRNGSSGTTTNGINITNTAGTLTNGLAFTGTIGTDINRASGILSLQGAGGITLSCAASTTCGLGNNATDHSTTVGSTSGTSLLTLQSGTGGLALTAGGSGNIVVGTSDTTGTLLVLDTKTNFTASQTSDPTGVAGGMYYNSAAGAFRCYEVDHWRDCLISARSEYHRVFELSNGQLNGGEIATNGSVSVAVNAETGHPSIAQLNTLSSSTGYSYLGSPGDNELLLGNNDYWRYEADLRIPTSPGLSNATDRYIVRSGFVEQSNNSDGSDGCFFKYSDNLNSGKWQGACLSSSVSSTCDTTTTVAAGTWYRLTVVVNAAGNSADFRINGVSKCTVSTNIPTGAGRVTGRGTSVQKTAGTTDRDVDIDYEEIEGQFGTPR